MESLFFVIFRQFGYFIINFVIMFCIRDILFCGNNVCGSREEIL